MPSLPVQKGGSVSLESRAYKSRYGCTIGIAAVRSCSANAANFAIDSTPGGSERLKLLVSNHRVLGVDPSRPDVRSDLATVQRFAAGVPLNDRTAEASRDRRRHSRYRIYAAPRNAHGNYKPSDTPVLIVKGFVSTAERNDYWERHVRPVNTNSPGARYEYVMCDNPDDGRRRFVSKRLYSNAKLIRGNL